MPTKTLAQRLAETTREALIEALIEAGANRTRAAEALGISPRQMFRLVAERLTSHDMNVILDACRKNGSLDARSANSGGWGDG